MKYSRIIALLAASTLLASFSAFAYDKDGDVKYDKDGDAHHHKKHAKPMQRYTLTGGATYLMPSVDGLAYAYTEQTAAPFETRAYDIDPSYNWGYFLAFGYMISSKYDIQASWQQYNSNDSDSLAISADYNLLTSNTGDYVTTPAEAKTSQEIKTQAFDATLGQYHKLTKTLTARPFVGVKYAKVDDNTHNTYTDAAGLYSETYNSSFSGVGPELGMDVEYGIYRQFGVVGHVAASFLIGNQETEGTAWDDGNDVQAPYKTTDNTRIVPALDAKLGLTWDSLYANSSFGVGLEAGYQVAYYFSAVDQAIVTNGAAIAEQSDLGVMGPYLNVSAMF